MLRKAFSCLYRRNATLAVTGLSHLIAALFVLLLLSFETRQLLGINLWIKPFKFLLSTAVYLWTLALLLAYLKSAYPRSVRWIAILVAVAMVVENLIITGQAGRGVLSHFNTSAGSDGLLFRLMGLFILINTLAVGYATVLFFLANYHLPRAYRWGIRAGLSLFLAGSLIGGVMIGANSHNIGVAMGGPGLPLLNWSREGGDLRVAHFLGLHALQFLPLAGYWASRSRVFSPNWSSIGVALIILLYSSLVFGLYHQAMSSLPVIGGLRP